MPWPPPRFGVLPAVCEQSSSPNVFGGRSDAESTKSFAEATRLPTAVSVPLWPVEFGTAGLQRSCPSAPATPTVRPYQYSYVGAVNEICEVL